MTELEQTSLAFLAFNFCISFYGNIRGQFQRPLVALAQQGTDRKQVQTRCLRQKFR